MVPLIPGIIFQIMIMFKEMRQLWLSP